MSDKSKPEEKKEENKDNKDDKDKKDAKLKVDDEDEEEDEGYTCGKCWNGYCGCVVWTCKCFYNTIVAIKDGIACCLGAIWYPMKERCCSCCDSCDKKMNPYKDPYYNEYDTI